MMNWNGVQNNDEAHQIPPLWMGRDTQQRPGQDHNTPGTHMQVVKIPKPTLWVNNLGMTLPSNVVDLQVRVRVTAHVARHDHPDCRYGDLLPNSPERCWMLYHATNDLKTENVKWPEIYVSKSTATSNTLLSQLSKYREGRADCIHKMPSIECWRWPNGGLIESATGYEADPDSVILRRLSCLTFKVGVRHHPTGIVRFRTWQPFVDACSYTHFYWYPNHEPTDEWIVDPPQSDSDSMPMDDDDVL